MRLFILFFVLYAQSAFAVESLSYSGRLVNTDGSPVTGSRSLRFELAYSNDPTTILCTKLVTANLTNGVFHARIDIAPGDCPGISTNPSLSTFLSDTTSGDQLIRVTDLTSAPKVYSFQPLFPVPAALIANTAKSLAPLESTDTGKILQWDGTTWTPVIFTPGGTYSSGSTIQAAAGTASSPSHSFSTDTDTGFYSAGANSVGVSVGGSQIFTFSSNGLVSSTSGGADITTLAGTETTPTYAFSGDNDTGWFAPLANTLALSTDGSERLRIDSTGRVGIGTQAPLGMLHIKKDWSSTAVSNFMAIIDSFGDQGRLTLRRANGDQATPTQILDGDYLGDLNFHGHDGSTFNSSPNAYISAVALEDFTSADQGTALLFGTTSIGSATSSEKMRLDDMGRLGVGTNSPTALIQIKAGTASAGSAPLKLTSGTNLTTPEVGAIEFDGTNLFFTTTTPTRKTIATTDGSTFTNTSSITNTGGNVNISPATLSGSVIVGPGAISTSSSTGTLVVSGDQGITGSINVGTKIMNAAGTAAAPTYTFGTDTDTGWFAPLADTLAAATNGQERVRISSTGNLGVGTTSPSSRLDVYALSGATAAGAFRTNDYVSTTSGSSLLFDFGASSGNTYSSISAVSNGGSANNNLVLQGSGGFVGLGNLSPTSKLEVNGEVRLDGSTSGYVGQRASATTTSYSMTWPNAVAASAGQVLTSDTSGNLSWVTPSAGGLTNFTESVNSAAPNATVPVVAITATNAATNVDVAIVPKGNGSFSLDVADGTVAGGNKRGYYSVDLQMDRTVNTRVASGSQSAILGGIQNTASAQYTSVLGGFLNTANQQGSTVAGGYGNTASGQYSIAAGNYSTAQSQSQATFGQYNMPKGSESSSSWVTTDPLFVIGNGTGSGASRSTAFMLLKNGNLGLGVLSPSARLEILGEMRMDGSTSGYIGHQASATTTSYTLTWPNAVAASAGQVLTSDTSGNLSWETPSAGGGGSLTNFTESVNSAAPNATVPVVAMTATNAATDVDVAIVPKGVGSFSLDVADGTVAGGNKRGNYAVDLQMSRGFNSKVASGSHSTVVGGDNNLASGQYSTVAGGQLNTASGQYSTIPGGYANFAIAAYSIASGFTSTASSLNQATFGRYNMPKGSENGTAWVTTDPLFVIGNGTGPGASRSTAFMLLKNGNLGLGVLSPSYLLDVNGDINIAAASTLKFAGTDVCTSAGCTVPSDKNLKENIHTLQDSLEKIRQIRGVEYNYKDKKRFKSNRRVGVIAQEVEKFFPEVVVKDPKSGQRSVAYDNFVAPLIESVKSLYHMISKRDVEMEKLKKENALMKARLDRIESMLKK